MSKPPKENFFEVSCKNCRYMASAKDFIVSVDATAKEWSVTYKYVTLKCPACGLKETIDKTEVL